MASVPRIDPATLHALLKGGAEVALLDVREEGAFAEAHILAASNAPLSRLERIVPPLVPRRATPVVLVDDDEALAARAAAVLGEAGYGDVAILAGGVPAWAAAGFATFAGVYVPSKAFAEFVEIQYGTPHIAAQEFEARRRAGDNIVLLDSRPFDEYTWITVPASINCPGAELILRVREAVTDDDALVVVNCGGRTRSIIGAQTLIDAGLPNRVMSLKDGTQGWHLAGLEVQRGASAVARYPTAEAHAWAREAARRLAERLRIETIDAPTLAGFVADTDRTLYRFDVRDPDEQRWPGRRQGFRPAPGGQLVQATDTFIAVRAARIVLADADGVRARATAAWLTRMGFGHVFVLDEAADTGPLVFDPHPEEVLGPDITAVGAVSPAELETLLHRGEAVVVDVATSREYRAGHVPGAWFAVRGRLAADAARLPKSPLYVVTSPDGVIARLAVEDLRRATRAEVLALAGGTKAWATTGRPLESAPENLASTPDDVFLKAFERREHREEAMRAYLQWELDLVEQVRRDGTIAFRL